MDTNLLVDNKIANGQWLINQLIRDQFGVEVAFWVKRSVEGLWELWIASPAVDTKNMKDALRKVFAVLSQNPDFGVMPSEITLVEVTNPIARAAIAVRDRNPGRDPVTYHGKQLGSLAIQEACIYPRQLPLEVREVDGRWEVLISDRDSLSCDSELEARTIAAAHVLEYEALARLRTSPDLTAELERTADVMEKYRLGFGARRLRRLAQDVRHQQAGQKEHQTPRV